jgi:hypothetical protein
MRAVSLARGVVGTRVGASGVRAAGTDAADVVPTGRGKGVFAAGGRGGGVIGPGGGTARGAGTPSIGDTGGLGIRTSPGFGASGADAGGGSEMGGREGRFIRTVSSSSAPAASPRRGGRVIRTVSFLGSLASAMVTLRGDNKSFRNFAVCHPSIDARTIKTHAMPGGRRHGHLESRV